MTMIRQHVGYRLPPALVSAIADAAALNGVTHTALVESWLKDRAEIEGWMNHGGEAGTAQARDRDGDNNGDSP